MSFFYNLSTRNKLLCSFICVIVLNIAVLVISMNSILYNIRASEKVDDILSQAFHRITGVMSTVELTNLKVIYGLNPEYKSYNPTDLLADSAKLLGDIEQAASVIRPNYFGRQDYADGCNKMVAEARAGVEKMRTAVLPLVQSGQYEEALSSYLRTAASHFTLARSTALELVEIQTEECLSITSPASDRTPVYTNTGLALLGTIIGLALALFISNYISKSMHQQIDILDKMAGGDFSFHIENGHNDEFGYAFKTLRKMRNSISEMMQRTKDECVRIQEQMRYLQQQASCIVEHSSNVETQAITVSAASEEMVSTTQDIARNCESAAQSSLICKEISDNGLQQVITSIQSIREQSEQTKDNAQKIESLAQQSKEIGSIVSTIDDIAAQTNLLALNAAIEAARAGEAGRGFAVVADEVRALASRTSASTQEISKMVKQIQDEAAIATESINDSVVNMEAIAEQTGSTEGLLKEIASHVLEVNQQITQIATAAEEQTTATSEIAVNMQNITHATGEMSSNAQQQSSSMDNTYDELEQLMHALAFFKTRKA